jgi:hypothetical protein
VLALLGYMAAKMPANELIRPTVDVAKRHAAEDRIAVEAERAAARALQDRLTHASKPAPLFPLSSSVRRAETQRRRVRRPNDPRG